MLTYSDQLTMSHVGLGNLNEYALLIAFGNAHSKALVHGLDINADQIVDAKGRQLYPAYFMTHLTVPPHLLLNSHTLWDDLEVGVGVRRFGDTLLDSTYMICQEGDEASREQEIAGMAGERVTMTANSLFVVDASVDNSTERQIAIPKPDCLAPLEKMAKPPAAIKRAREVRMAGLGEGETMEQLASCAPFTYELLPGRDTHANHAMIFAKFSEIMNVAEYDLLTRQLIPGLSHRLYDCLRLLEREVYYYGNCFGGERLQVFLKGKLEPCAPDFHGKNLRLISGGILTLTIEIYQEKDNTLLSMAKVKKLVAIPTQAQELKSDLDRYFHMAGKG